MLMERPGLSSFNIDARRLPAGRLQWSVRLQCDAQGVCGPQHAPAGSSKAATPLGRRRAPQREATGATAATACGQATVRGRPTDIVEFEHYSTCLASATRAARCAETAAARRAAPAAAHKQHPVRAVQKTRCCGSKAHIQHERRHAVLHLWLNNTGQQRAEKQCVCAGKDLYPEQSECEKPQQGMPTVSILSTAYFLLPWLTGSARCSKLCGILILTVSTSSTYNLS